MAYIMHSVLVLREFVVNIISEWFVEAANHTCGNYDHGIDEMQLASLTPEASVKVEVDDSGDCNGLHS